MTVSTFPRPGLPMALLAALMMMTVTSCSELGAVSVTRDTGESVVMGRSGGLLDNVLPVNVIPAMKLNFDLQNELQKQNADGANAVYLTDLTLMVTESEEPEGDEDNFDFLDEIKVYVESSDKNSSLPRQLIAERVPVPEGTRSFALDVDDTIDLKPYAEEGIRLTTSGSGEFPPDNTSVKGQVTLSIDIF